MVNELENFVNKVVRQNVEHILLRCLSEQEDHGYAIISKIRRELKVYLGPSTVYPALHKLEQRKLVEASWDMTSARARKTYKITTKGLREFEHQKTVVQQVFQEVTRIGS